MSFQFSLYQIAELAVEVEEAAADFYLQLALRTEDEAIKAMFNLLSKQEAGHRNVFASIAERLRAKNEEHEYAIDLYVVMKNTLDKLKNMGFSSITVVDPQNIMEALGVAMNAEKSSVDVYTRLRNTVSEQFHQTLDEIIRVEQYHCEWVSDLRNKVTGSS
jgi:rubrerythrin